MMKNIWEGFKKIPFPDENTLLNLPGDSKSVVYVLGVEYSRAFIPFYVGETGRFLSDRLWDYVYADFQAATDFKVGTAVRLILEKNLQVVVSHKTSGDRKMEEKTLADELRIRGYRLLNDLSGYDYRTAVKKKEREKIQRWVNAFWETMESRRVRAAIKPRPLK